ncbi:MAG TPA: type VI secretion system protein TssA [Gemmatimonadaceae bacterium]
MKRVTGGAVRAYDASTESGVPSLLQDVARPFAEPTPCGRDVAYDAEFLRLKEEIDRLNAVDLRVDQQQATALTQALKEAHGQQRRPNGNGSSAQASSFDAELVVSLAHAILRDHSKDLRVAAYLALGLARRDGVRGIAEGSGAIEIVVRQFWDGAFPPAARMAGRLNAIDAGIGWLTDALERAKPVAADRESLEAASRAVASLRELSAGWNNERVTTRLVRFAGDLGDAIAKLPAEAAPTPTPRRASPRPAPTPTVEAPSQPQANGVIERVVETPIVEEALPQPPSQALDPVIERALRLLKEDPKRSSAYRLVRVYRWEPLVQLPPSTKKQTRIEPPPARRREYLARLYGEQNWSELLLQAEESFGQNPFHFWLDLQRFTLDALGALGPEYAAAREGVLAEVKVLATRLPGLAGLSFADGTRFASPESVRWLEGLVAPAPGVSDRPTDSGEADRFADAKKRFIDGDLNGALALLEAGAVHETSDRQRFQRRAVMASLCLESGQFAVARALLEELAEVVEANGLAKWEPELAMSVWTRQYACYAGLATRLPRGAEAEQLGREMESVFGQICRVDTMRALATAQEGRRPPP